MLWIRGLIGLFVLVFALIYLSKLKVPEIDCTDLSVIECSTKHQRRTYLVLAKQCAILLLNVVIVIHILNIMGVKSSLIATGISFLIVIGGLIGQPFLNDLMSGFIFIFNGTIALNSVIRVSVSDCNECTINKQTMRVKDVSMFSLTCETSENEIVFIRYSTITAVETLS